LSRHLYSAVIVIHRVKIDGSFQAQSNLRIIIRWGSDVEIQLILETVMSYHVYWTMHWDIMSDYIRNVLHWLPTPNI